MAHRGGVDGVAAAADSGGSGDGRGTEKGGRGRRGAPHTTDGEDKMEEGKKGYGGAKVALLY
jgi:hypothetical protein